MSQRKNKGKTGHEEASMENIYKTLIDMDTRLSEKLNEVDENLSEHVSAQAIVINQLNEVIAALRERVDSQEGKIMNLEKENSRLNSEFEQLRLHVRKEDLAREHYSKRMNVLIHGIPEEAEEKKLETTKKTKDLIANTLECSDVTLIDCHRLGKFRSSSDEHGTITPRPIIFKVGTLFVKDEIFKSLKALKSHNEINNLKIFFTDHLPKELYLKKKSLIPEMKRAKANKVSFKWVTTPGDINLFVEGQKVYA